MLIPHAPQDDPWTMTVFRAKSGCERSFERLMQPLMPLVYGAAWEVLHNTQDAQDVAQEALTSAWKHLGNFEFEADVRDPQTQFRVWLRRVTLSRAIDAQRARRSRTPEGGWVRSWSANPDAWGEGEYRNDGNGEREGCISLDMGDGGIEEGVVARMEAQKLLAWIERMGNLTPPQSIALRMVVAGGYSYKETATLMTERTGKLVTVSAVKSLLNRARKAVRKGKNELRKNELRRAAFRRRYRDDEKREALLARQRAWRHAHREQYRMWFHKRMDRLRSQQPDAYEAIKAADRARFHRYNSDPVWRAQRLAAGRRRYAENEAYRHKDKERKERRQARIREAAALLKAGKLSASEPEAQQVIRKRERGKAWYERNKVQRQAAMKARMERIKADPVAHAAFLEGRRAYKRLSLARANAVLTAQQEGAAA
jgi:RNA polymerase sigma factor (sigma-70 family)